MKWLDNFASNLGKKQFYRSHKYKYALKYFFDFASRVLLEANNQPEWKKGAVFLSEEDTYNFRKFWESQNVQKGSFGIFFYSKIELNATNFANHHIENNSTNLIDEMLTLKPGSEYVPYKGVPIATEGEVTLRKKEEMIIEIWNFLKKEI